MGLNNCAPQTDDFTPKVQINHPFCRMQNNFYFTLHKLSLEFKYCKWYGLNQSGKDVPPPQPGPPVPCSITPLLTAM